MFVNCQGTAKDNRKKKDLDAQFKFPVNMLQGDSRNLYIRLT